MALTDHLCACGCGRITPRATANRPERGYRKGEPLRYFPGHGRRKMPEADRFLAKLKLHPLTGCLEFQGHRHNGYGQFGVGSRDDGTRGLVYAHRYAWVQARGPIPAGLDVLHRCDNPPCCSPDHLFLGTDQDNREDMARKWRGRGGRMPFGAGRIPCCGGGKGGDLWLTEAGSSKTSTPSSRRRRSPRAC
jgi:hypothetical protein